MSRSNGKLFYALLFISFLLNAWSCNRTPEVEELSADDAVTTTDAGSGSLQKVRLLPYWITTAQFAGYYIGRNKGIFQQYGIDLTIIPFQTTIQTDQVIRNKEADFFLLWLVNAIDLKDSGLDIVNIAQLSSKSSLMLITKKSSGIATIADMEGKHAAIWSDYMLQPKALFSKHHVDVHLIPIGSSNNLFLRDGAEIINASWFDEYHTILNCGYNEDELETFFFADHGLNFLEDGIYCLRSELEKDTALCRRFVGATIESWEYAFLHPDEAIRIVLEEQRKQMLPANLPHQRWMLDRYRDLYYPDSSAGINTNLPEAEYLNIANILLQAGLIETIPDFSSFFVPVLDPPTSSR